MHGKYLFVIRPFVRWTLIQMLLPKTPHPHENKDNIMQIHSILLQSEAAGLARDIRVYMPMKVRSGKPLANGGCRVKLKMQVNQPRKVTNLLCQKRILQIRKN